MPITIHTVPLSTNEWTSVKEDLPTPHKDCLIITDSGRLAIRRFCVNKFSKGASEVLYWIELPKVRTFKGD